MTGTKPDTAMHVDQNSFDVMDYSTTSSSGECAGWEFQEMIRRTDHAKGKVDVGFNSRLAFRQLLAQVIENGCKFARINTRHASSGIDSSLLHFPFE
jgi:hypothetical protein